jgi:hypothetical protein
MIGRPSAWVVAIALCSTPMSVDANVGSFTGDDYLRLCATINLDRPQNDLAYDRDRDMAIYCAGYIEAAVVLIVLMDKQSYCLPTGATSQDVVKVTVAFMQAHREQRKQLLASVMVAAVQAQWPCRS